MTANLGLKQHVCSRYAAVKHTRRGRLVAAAAAAATRQQQQHSHVHELSMALLVNKNLEKQLGRGLVHHSQLIEAHSIINSADYALLLIGNSSSSSRAAAAAAAAEQPLHGAWPVLYANQAAVDAVSSCSSSSGAGQAEHSAAAALQHVQLPAAVSALIEQQQQQQQQHQATASSSSSSSSCMVLQDVVWQPQQQHDAGSSSSSSSCSSLTVEQLLACQVYAPNDAYIGVVLLFDAWRHADGCLGLPGWPRVEPASLPSQQQLQAAADAVRAQADAVRELKQGQGLGNKDPAVLEAVAALQQLKQQLAHLEGLQQAFEPGRQRQLQQLLQQQQQKQKQQEAEEQQQAAEQ